MTSYPGQWRTVPDPPECVWEATQSERDACLRVLERLGAMDVAPMLGLAPQPPRGRRPPCTCGSCYRCRVRAQRAAPWTCHVCGRAMRAGSATRHLLIAHRTSRA